MNSDANGIPCLGCGAIVAKSDGPTHAYIGASPGCWAVYGQVLAREYGEFAYPACHRLTVDAYAAQHPGRPSRRSIRSVAMHLVSLFLVLEEGLASDQATARIRHMLRRPVPFVWLAPPSFNGSLTIVDVAAAGELAEHEHLVGRWAASVWDAWHPHHETVRHWAAEAWR